MYYTEGAMSLAPGRSKSAKRRLPRQEARVSSYDNRRRGHEWPSDLPPELKPMVVTMPDSVLNGETAAPRQGPSVVYMPQRSNVVHSLATARTQPTTIHYSQPQVVHAPFNPRHVRTYTSRQMPVQVPRDSPAGYRSPLAAPSHVFSGPLHGQLISPFGQSPPTFRPLPRSPIEPATSTEIPRRVRVVRDLRGTPRISNAETPRNASSILASAHLRPVGVPTHVGSRAHSRDVKSPLNLVEAAPFPDAAYSSVLESSVRVSSTPGPTPVESTPDNRLNPIESRIKINQTTPLDREKVEDGGVDVLLGEITVQPPAKCEPPQAPDSPRPAAPLQTLTARSPTELVSPRPAPISLEAVTLAVAELFDLPVEKYNDGTWGLVEAPAKELLENRREALDKFEKRAYNNETSEEPPPILNLISRYTLERLSDSMPTQLICQKGDFVPLQKHLMNHIVQEQQPRELFRYYYEVAKTCTPSDASVPARVVEARRLHTLLRRVLEVLTHTMEIEEPGSRGWRDSSTRWSAFSQPLKARCVRLHGVGGTVSLHRFDVDLADDDLWPHDFSEEDITDVLSALQYGNAAAQVAGLAASAIDTPAKAEISQDDFVHTLLTAPFCLPECPVTEFDIPESINWTANPADVSKLFYWRVVQCTLVLAECLDSSDTSKSASQLTTAYLETHLCTRKPQDQHSHGFLAGLCRRPRALVAHDVMLSGVTSLESLQVLVMTRHEPSRSEFLVPRSWLDSTVTASRVCADHQNVPGYACPCLWGLDTVFMAVCAVVAVTAAALVKGKEWVQLKKPLSLLTGPLDADAVAARFVVQLKETIDFNRACAGLQPDGGKPHVCVLFQALPRLLRTARTTKALNRVLLGLEGPFSDHPCPDHDGETFLGLLFPSTLRYCECRGRLDSAGYSIHSDSIPCAHCDDQDLFDSCVNLSAYPEGALNVKTVHLNLCVAVFARVASRIMDMKLWMLAVSAMANKDAIGDKIADSSVPEACKHELTGFLSIFGALNVPGFTHEDFCRDLRVKYDLEQGSGL